jgi:DNA polymerase III subunit beta
MEFTINKNVLQKELGYLQGAVDKKHTVPALSNILVESIGEKMVRIVGTDLDVTLRCESEAEIKTPGAMCVGVRKLFDIARVLPDAPVNFRKDSNNWVSITCERSNFRVAGLDRNNFPEVPVFKSAPAKIPASVFKTLIERTIFSVTLEESRYTLSGAKFILNKGVLRMVTTDGHRLAFVEHRGLSEVSSSEEIDVLIPRKTLSELNKLISSNEDQIGVGADENHIYFEVGTRLLISRTLTGQFPNYEMVMPKANDKRAEFDSNSLGQAIRRVALMADDRSHTVKFNLTSAGLQISSQTAEEGEAQEFISTEYSGDDVEIGFNASYLQDFLNVVNEGNVLLEFKDGSSQAQLRPSEDKGFDYRYVVMPMRL